MTSPVDLNTVTIGNMSIDNQPVKQMAIVVVAEESQLTPVQENQLRSQTIGKMLI